MKQLIQNFRTGRTIIEETPLPSLGFGQILIQTARSLLSAGTERMLIEFSQGNLLQKAKSQPEKVKLVLDKIRSDGFLVTYDSVSKRLDEPMPLGYCNAGRVTEVSEGVTEFQIGDRVVSNGSHAEMVCVPKNLCSKIPDSVSDEEASFTVLASIALQGIRLAKPELGENFVVFGAGLIGILTVQLLKACGCNVMALDINDTRLELARTFGAETCNVGDTDPISGALSWTNGKGVDGILVTASTKSNEIIHQSAQMARKRGRIILVGVVGLGLQRSDFYEKELTFQVSCSYGPGRYDDHYEKKGIDYPYGFVRWTEQRNFEAILNTMATKQLMVDRLITHRFSISEAEKAYVTILTNPSALGVILEYPKTVEIEKTITIHSPVYSKPSACVAAMIGSGDFAKMTMAPALAKTKARLKYVTAQTNSVSAVYIAKKYGFEKVSTDLDKVFADTELSTVFITTNHNSHASLVKRSLECGLHVFVEKPLALSVDELIEINQLSKQHPHLQMMVGFNRRFSPHVIKMKDLLKGRVEPLSMIYTVNAGAIPADAWIHDLAVGGGRIIGEGCHFIDLLSYISDSPIVSVGAFQFGNGVTIKEDKMSIILAFADGSIGTVNYFSNGHKAYPKETLEVFSEGRTLKLENFRKMYGYGFKGFYKYNIFRMDKGHLAELDAFVKRVENGREPLISLENLVNVTLASFAAVTSAKAGRIIHINQEYSNF